MINSNDSVFNSGIFTKFTEANAIDYFIFLNVIRATDNTSKNIYIARYNTGYPYFYTPWDLDGTWGNIYDGTEQNIFNDILSNGLYDRLIKNNTDSIFPAMSQRWFELRQGMLSTEQLQLAFDSAQQILSGNNVYAREQLVWDYNYDPSYADYVNTWRGNRLSFLDNYFSPKILAVQSPVSSSINIYPVPAKDHLTIDYQGTAGTAYEIVSLQGTSESAGTLNNGSNYLSTEKLVNGIYLILINNVYHKISVIR